MSMASPVVLRSAPCADHFLPLLLLLQAERPLEKEERRGPRLFVVIAHWL